MSDKIYQNLAKVLDTLPNGFPATESGIEIKLLKKINLGDGPAGSRTHRAPAGWPGSASG
jgi:hypothetical protein